MKTLIDLLHTPVFPFLPACLPTWLSGSAARQQVVLPRPRPLHLSLPELVLDEVAVPGCGWFNSSHELQSGLLVTEHSSDAAAATVLPPDAWGAWGAMVDWHLPRGLAPRAGLLRGWPARRRQRAGMMGHLSPPTERHP